MEKPKPTEHHMKLKRLVGSWRGTEIMHPSQWDPKGGEATGMSDNSLALDGFAVICNYQQRRRGIATYSGHGVWTYDQQTDQIVLHWFDSLGSPPEVFRGVWNGDFLVVTHDGPDMHSRLRYDVSREGRLSTQMEMSADGKDWKRLFDGSYELK